MTAAIPAALIALIVAIGVTAVAAVRAFLTREPKGSHSRPFADPADTSDPDGSLWVRSLAADPDRPVAKAWQMHHEPPFPVAGTLTMLPPDPAPDGPAAYLPPQPESEWSATAWTRKQAKELERWLDENVRSVKVPEFTQDGAA